MRADRGVGHLEIVNAVRSSSVESRRSLVRYSYNDRLMQRDLRHLADTQFDVLVVGAGFYGVTAAWDAAQRGLSVAIIDKDDFGAATSFNNLKTLHGGLRSLQALNFTQMRLFIRERRALARILPHLVRPAAVRGADDAQSEAKRAGDADRPRDERCRGQRSQRGPARSGHAPARQPDRVARGSAAAQSAWSRRRA